MMKDNRRELESAEREFLAKEFDHFTDSLARNEALGESRLSFFVGLVSAVFVGLGFIARRDGDHVDLRGIAEIAAVACGGLLALGLLTLGRVLRRNDVTDDYIRTLTKIRELMVPKLMVPTAAEYLPRRKKRRALHGGLAQTAGLMNVGLAALLGWFLGKSSSVIVMTGLGVGVIQIAVIWWHQRERQERGESSNRSPPSPPP